jgi:hypothetical protein
MLFTAVVSPVSLPTPNQLYRQFELGQISREQLHSSMAVHARLILAEVEEVRVNPVVAFMDHMLCKRLASKLSKQHTEEMVREVLVALADIPQFPPATLLWNADHELVPLECFFRIKRAPVFTIHQMIVEPQQVIVHIEHGARDSTRREEIHLRRSRQGKLQYVTRQQSK